MSFRYFLGRLAILVLLLPMTAAAQETPRALDGGHIVTAATVAQLSAENAVVVDTRALHDFLAGHLPNAVHVDYREHSRREVNFDAGLDDLTAFKARLGKFAKLDQAVVFYCNGTACWKSYKAARIAAAEGYRRVYWFRGGVSEWREAGRELISE